MLLYQWPVPTPTQLGAAAITSSSNSSKVSETDHGGADARTPLPESAAVTAVLQISHDGLGEYVDKGRRFWEGPTGNAMQGPLTANRRPDGVSGQCFGSPLAPTDSLGHWTALAAGQCAEEMENYQLAGSQVLRQGMGIGCKGESLDVMQKPGWVDCPDAV